MKHRRKVFVNGAVVDLLMTKTGKMAEMFIVDILVVECYKDHFQLLFQSIAYIFLPKNYWNSGYLPRTFSISLK